MKSKNANEKIVSLVDVDLKLRKLAKEIEALKEEIKELKELFTKKALRVA